MGRDHILFAGTVNHHSAFLFLCIVLGIWCTQVSPSRCQADTIQIEQQISFGEVTAHPHGDRIIVNASTGSAKPKSESGLSLVTGGNNGRLSYTASSGNAGKYVQIVYPGTLVLRCKTDSSQTLSIDGFSSYSTTGITTQTYSQDIYIGGRLIINPDQKACQYTGTLEITFVTY